MSVLCKDCHVYMYVQRRDTNKERNQILQVTPIRTSHRAFAISQERITC